MHSSTPKPPVELPGPVAVLLRYLPLLAIAALPGWYLFKADSYWLDEIFTLSMAGDSAANIIREWLPNEVHPPLYTLLMRGWVSLFGYGEIATRLSSYLLYLGAMVSYAYWMRSSRLIPFLLGAFFLFNFQLAYYSLEVRSYMLQFFLSILFVCRYCKTQKWDATAKWLLCLLAATHVFSFILAGMVLLLSFFKKETRTKRPWLQKAFMHFWPMLPATLYLLWLVLFGNVLQFAGGNFWIKTDTMAAIKMIGLVFVPLSNLLSTPVLLVAGTLFFTVLGFLYYRHRHHATGNCLATFGLCMVLFLLLNAHSPLIVPRYLLVFLPLVFIPLVYNLQPITTPPLWSNALGTAFCGLVLLLTLKWTRESLIAKTKPKDPIKEQAAYLQSAQQPVYFLLDPVFSQYYSEHMLRRIGHFYRWKDFGEQQQFPAITAENLGQVPRPFVLQLLHSREIDVPAILQKAGITRYTNIHFTKSGQPAMSYCVEVP